MRLGLLTRSKPSNLFFLKSILHTALTFIYKTADKNLGTKMKSIISNMQRLMGVQMFVIVGYRRPNGDLSKLQ